MGALHDIGIKHHTDKAYDHDFMKFYEAYLDPIRHQKINLLEIGIWQGESLRTFEEFFPEGQIYGIDIVPKPHYKTERIHVAQGDQGDRDFLRAVFPEVKEFDVIIDDGSHMVWHQQISLGALFPRLKVGGIYVVEDLHTSFKQHCCKVPECGDSTVRFLYTLDLLHPLSAHMEQVELQYLLEHVALVNVHTSRINHRSVTSVIIKK